MDLFYVKSRKSGIQDILSISTFNWSYSWDANRVFWFFYKFNIWIFLIILIKISVLAFPFIFFLDSISLFLKIFETKLFDPKLSPYLAPTHVIFMIKSLFELSHFLPCSATSFHSLCWKIFTTVQNIINSWFGYIFSFKMVQSEDFSKIFIFFKNFVYHLFGPYIKKTQ